MTSERYSEPHSAAMRRGSDSSAAGVAIFESLLRIRFRTPRGDSPALCKAREHGGPARVRGLRDEARLADALDPGVVLLFLLGFGISAVLLLLEPRDVFLDPLLGARAAAVLFERNPLADGAQVLR